MKRFLIGIGLAALAATPVLAQRGALPQRPDRVAPVTRAQVQAQVQQRFAALDTNRDGAITRAELDASRDRMMRQRQADRGARRDQLFAMLDTDRNGSLSRPEFAAGRRDGGKGSRGGRHGRRGAHRGGAMAMRGGRMGAGWLERLDADGDGRVTLAEASAGRLQRFDRIDSDKDGTVTPEERRAARAGWPSRRG